MGFWEALGTGIAAAVAFPSVVGLLALLLPERFTAVILGALLFAVLAVGVVGLGAWRATFAALIRSDTPEGAGRLGLGLGLGIILGHGLSFELVIQPVERDLLEMALASGFYAVWGTVLVASLALFLRWIAAGASVWLEVAAAGRSPRPTLVAGLVTGSALLAVWYAFLFEIGEAASLGALLPLLLAMLAPLGSITTVAQHPLTYLVLISLWAFPLAAWFWQGRLAPTRGPSWAWLDSCANSVPLPRGEPLRPWLALAAGVRGGLVCCAPLLIMWVGWRGVVPGSTRALDAAVLLFFGLQVAIVVLVQAGVAARVTARVRRLGALHGAFAAFVTAVVATGGMLGLNVLFGGTINPHFATIVFGLVANLGAFVAWPVSLVVGLLTGRDGPATLQPWRMPLAVTLGHDR
jgi:hypothetical protein